MSHAPRSDRRGSAKISGDPELEPKPARGGKHIGILDEDDVVNRSTHNIKARLFGSAVGWPVVSAPGLLWPHDTRGSAAIFAIGADPMVSKLPVVSIRRPTMAAYMSRDCASVSRARYCSR